MTRKIVLLNDTRGDHHHGCTAVNDTIDVRCAAHNMTIVARAPAHRDWREDADFVRSFDSADLALINGEGTLHSDKPQARWLLEAGARGRRNGVATALINFTWANNSDAMAAKLRDFTLLSVRESVSRRLLEDRQINARCVPDLALATAPPASRPRRGILYTDNVLVDDSIALDTRMKALGAEPLSIVRRRPEFLRHSVGLVRAYQRFWKAAGTVGAIGAAQREWSGRVSTKAAFLDRLASCELVVTGRFHVLVLALATRTPFLVVASNTHKNLATLNDAGVGPWRHVDAASIDHALVERARLWQDGESEALDTFLRASEPKVETLFSDIANLTV